MKFSIIVPVYNRSEEINEFLNSLKNQTDRDFEVIIMEGTCVDSCKKVIDRYSDCLNIKFFEENTGRSTRRNNGMALASGDYFLLFDSDCILPPQYISIVRKCLSNNYLDCFGGPDNADDSFTDFQLAINYSMTSIMTTGGIRGGRKKMKNFMPRAFNMGFSRKVFEITHGYREMIGEDVDLSMRIKESGFSVGLIPDAYVYHKRRITLKGFFKQVNTFGKARVLLSTLHPGSFRIMHLMPSAFFLGNIFLILLSVLFLNAYFLFPIFLYVLMIFIESLCKNKKLKIALLSIVTSYCQLFGYGIGYIDEFITRRASKRNAESLYRQ